MKAICVDDERLLAEDVADMCEALPEIDEVKCFVRANEALADLVDKQGIGVTRKEVFSVIWENRAYDRKMQKQLDVYIRSLRDTLREYGIGEMFELSRGTMRILPEHFTCDAYQFFLGDSDAVNAYQGEYMYSYSWASMIESLKNRSFYFLEKGGFILDIYWTEYDILIINIIFLTDMQSVFLSCKKTSRQEHMQIFWQALPA